ncbi:hypothetical protein G3I43_07165 [Streptomyces anulatus]|uniref:Uncharacterized protein n=1 Tax=Streptomyces anulatus TaxID=1892 RepID=A0A6G3SNG0_STRAQ|nr:hypothetical protein [Streptomyces anulatus]NEB83958.1 hypothetical protein [Streptomyces anulatus]
MSAHGSEYDEDTGHYDECPQHTDPSDPRCYCTGIANAQDSYYEEPADMREH